MIEGRGCVGHLCHLLSRVLYWVMCIENSSQYGLIKRSILPNKALSIDLIKLDNSVVSIFVDFVVASGINGELYT